MDLVRRIRWDNVAKAAALLAVVSLIVAWPRLRAAPLELPPPPAPVEAEVEAEEPAPLPAAAPMTATTAKKAPRRERPRPRRKREARTRLPPPTLATPTRQPRRVLAPPPPTEFGFE